MPTKSLLQLDDEVYGGVKQQPSVFAGSVAKSNIPKKSLLELDDEFFGGIKTAKFQFGKQTPLLKDPELGMKVGKKATELGIGLVRNLAKLPVQFPRMIASGLSSIVGNEEMKARFAKPVDVPLIGEIKGLSTIPNDVGKYETQTPKQTLGQAGMMFLEGGAPLLGKIVKKPFTLIAEKLYQSALKPTKEAIEAGVIQTGLKERVWLTSGGVEKTANKIDDLETKLGEIIESGKAAGKTVKTAGIKQFVDPIRGWFETVDTTTSKTAQEYIDITLENFLKRYGDDIPIEQAQKLKVNTMRYLRDAYGELTNVGKETQKQMARFLKEEIVENIPEAGNINARLKNLYALDNSLEKASRRIGNLNLLGLGVKIGAVTQGKTGTVIGLITDLLDKAGIKSGTAITLNELTRLSGRLGVGARIPIVELLNYIQKKAENRSYQSENNK